MAITKKGSDPSRADRKAKKRKLEDAIPDLPGDNDQEEIASSTDKPTKKRKRTSEETGPKDTTEEKERKYAKKEKKQKRAELEDDLLPVKEEGVKKLKKSKQESTSDETTKETSVKSEGTDEAEEAPKKSKKERKAERKAREAVEKAATQALAQPDKKPILESETNGSAAPASTEEKKSKKNNRNREKKRKAALESGVEGKAPRFIAFVGNLPYTTTTESLQKHFASVKPKSVRHSTEKDNPKKSKGFAFVEFEGYDHMKTCLKLFHHSTFDDGLSAPRKINVELTAGGGGNTSDRKAKIQGKNERLNEQRVRRMQEEEKTKATKSGAAALDENSIHPSRRTRVPV